MRWYVVKFKEGGISNQLAENEQAIRDKFKDNILNPVVEIKLMHNVVNNKSEYI